MSEQARNVELLKDAYKRWHDSKGGSLDHLLSLVADDIKFRSIARGQDPLGFTQPVNKKAEVARLFRRPAGRIRHGPLHRPRLCGGR